MTEDESSTPDEPESDDEPSHRQERARFSELNPWVRLALIVAVVFLAVVIGGNLFVNWAGLDKTGDRGVFGGGGVSPELQPLPTPSAATYPSYSPIATPSPSVFVPKGDSASLVPAGLVLTQPPDSVAAGQSVAIAGTYGGHDNVSLDIQRYENGVWADFPVTAQVVMGQFSATVTLSQKGVNQLRVLDQTQQRASNVVFVAVN